VALLCLTTIKIRTMKRIMLAMCLLIFAIGLQAQTATVNISELKSYTEYLVPVGQTSGTTTSFVVKGNQHQPTTQDLVVHLDSIAGGTHSSTVKLYGSKFSPYTWVQIGNTPTTWKATSGDTTIYISNATAARYRDFKIEIVNASGDNTSIAWWKFKLWRE
jgi:hypothetical protein